MLKSVRLKNFKLHEDTQIEAAPITVFIGPNNSGKSSIFQALLALRQAAVRGVSEFLRSTQRAPTSADQPYLFPAQEILDVGEFKDVLRHGQSESRIGATGTIHPRKPLGRGGPVEVSFDVGVRDNVVFYHSGHLQSPHGGFDWEWVGPFLPTSPPYSIRVDTFDLSFTVVPSFHLIGLSGYGPTTADLEQMADIRELGEYLGRAPVRVLESLHPIFALRGFEEWGYPLPMAPAEGVERVTLSDRAIAVASILAYNRNLEEELSQRLEKLLGIGVKVTLVPPKRVSIRATTSGQKGATTLFANEGTGANQLPFILVPIALAPAHETVLLSEPEAHLHPKGQCELTRMLLTVAKKENIQFFIETHSEHVLHVILNAVGRGDWAKDDVALHYFENVEGTAQVKRLGINEHGQVDGGLPGFFDQSLAELTEYLDGLRKH